jgi:hypothetical protein
MRGIVQAKLHNFRQFGGVAVALIAFFDVVHSVLLSRLSSALN